MKDRCAVNSQLLEVIQMDSCQGAKCYITAKMSSMFLKKRKLISELGLHIN
jgi:hypothetical protein